LCIDLDKLKNVFPLELKITSPPTKKLFLSNIVSHLEISLSSALKPRFLSSLSSQSTYELALSCVHSKYKVTHPVHQLENILMHLKDTPIIWKAPYRFPSSKKDGDISWRLNHGSLSTPVLLHKMKLTNTPTCPYCGELGTLAHMFISCKKLTSMRNFLNVLSHKVDSSLFIDDKFFLTYIHDTRSSLPRESKCLIDFLITLAKSVIYKTYMAKINSNDNTNTISPLSSFQSKLKNAINGDYAKWKQRGDIEGFNTVWGPIGIADEDGTLHILGLVVPHHHSEQQCAKQEKRKQN
jgi:hypothetical protein